MRELFDLLAPYVIRVLPGFLLGLAAIFFFRKAKDTRIFIYILLFILFRDTMTPLGFWRFGSEGLFWMRFIESPLFLLVFGLVCIGITLSLYFLDKPNQKLFLWKKGSSIKLVLSGIVGALVVTAPLMLLYQFVPIASRGGAVSPRLLPFILFFAVAGNFMEEGIFRGYVRGRLAEFHSPLKAALLSGLVFAFCHIFLATTVTNAGWPLLLFALWEGLIVGVIGMKHGVLASSITHGGAIFILSSGLV